VKLVSPLQRYVSEVDGDKIMWTPVPFLHPKRDKDSLDFWTVSTAVPSRSFAKPQPGARGRSDLQSGAADTATNIPGKEGESVEKDEIRRLMLELQEAQSTISRWEKVNNKLMTKLSPQQKS